MIIFAFTLFFVQTNHQPVVAQDSALNIAEPSLSEIDSYLAINEAAPNPLIYAKHYLLMSADNAEEIISRDAHAAVPVASTTKMVTALVAREHFQLDDVVTVGRLATNVVGSKVGLRYQEKITVHDLLKALLINSGNDAAFALAEHFSEEPGNYQKFVTQMNRYVKDVGLTDSVFADPAGLGDETGRSTAFDLAHIARLTLADPVLADIIKIRSATISSIDGQLKHELKSSNRLILNDQPEYLPGAVGVKTGFTHGAGHCLVSAYNSRHGLLIGVVLNTNEYTVTASAQESKKLLQWADRYLETVEY